MGTADGTESRTLNSVLKSLDIIEALWEADGAGVTELTERTQLPKSTVHVHLSTLREKGYVVQVDDEYRLSLRFLTYGEYVKRSEPLYETAKGPIQDLAERTGERVFCTTHQNGLATILCVAEGDRSLTSTVTAGTDMYLHASACGKAMLSHFSIEKIDDVIDEWGLPAFTEDTITTRDELLAELELTRERGVSINTEEYRPGVHTIAAPILDPDGTVRGAVSLAGPKRRLRSEWGDDELHNHVLATANTIEVNLGYP